MYSSSDFQKLWFLYKTEGAPKGISLESFCQSNGIPYEPFSKWFGKYHRSVIPLQVDGRPEEASETKRHDAVTANGQVLAEEKGFIQVIIKSKDGFLLQKDGLSYVGLKLLVERLEAFFTAVIKGRTDYENLMPATIGISKMK